MLSQGDKITVIVMLILVGVTINVALNGGLFEQATRAKTDTELAIDEEELQEAIVVAYDPKTNTIDINVLKRELRSGWVVSEGNAPWTCTSPNNNEFRVSADGILTNVKEENIDTPITYFKYEVNSENEITIKGLSEEGIAAINSGTTSFKIPSVIEEKTVTQIGDAAFIGFDMSSAESGEPAFLPTANITKIILPNTLKTIGDYAFTYTKLSTINLPDSLITIGSAAFAYTQLSTVQIPESVTTIGDGAVSDAQLAGIVEISSSKFTTIGACVFGSNDNLKVKVDFASSDSSPEGWDIDWRDRNLCYLYRCRN